MVDEFVGVIGLEPILSAPKSDVRRPTTPNSNLEPYVGLEPTTY